MIHDKLNFILSYWQKQPSFFNDPKHVFFWGYLFSFLFLSLTSLYLNYQKGWSKELLKILKNPDLKDELIFDLKHYFFRLLFAPFIIALTGFSIFKIQIYLQSLMKNSFMSFQYTPLAQLSHSTGALFYATFTLLAWDFSRYFAHRLSHTVPFFWYFHEYHHRSNMLNPLTKYRVHPVSTIIMNTLTGIIMGLSIIAFYCIFSLDVYLPVIETGIVHHLLFKVFAHSRHSPFPISYGPFLNKVLISPAMHQVHHSVNKNHLNKNYGVFFALWDNLFNSIYIPKINEPMMFSHCEKNKSLKDELLRPFKLMKGSS